MFGKKLIWKNSVDKYQTKVELRIILVQKSSSYKLGSAHQNMDSKINFR